MKSLPTRGFFVIFSATQMSRNQKAYCKRVLLKKADKAGPIRFLR